MEAIEKGRITAFYNKYRENLIHSMAIEADLMIADDRQGWVAKLRQKSDFLRKTYQENEEELALLIYPYVKKEKKLDLITATEFYENICDMTMNAENDSLLTTEMLKLLMSFYLENDMEDEWINTTYMLALTYADRSDDISAEKARDYFEEVSRRSDRYCLIKSWEARQRIIQSFFNCITDKDVQSNEERLARIVLYENANRMISRADVRELDSTRMDFDRFKNDMRINLMWALVRSDSVPNRAVIEYVVRELLPDGITRENLNEQSSVDAVTYVWCNLYSGMISANLAVSLLFGYYRTQTDEIDYKKINLFYDDAYESKITCMQECFRLLALPEVSLDEREQLFYELAAEFKHIYTSTPYLANNNYINDDLCQTVRLMLRIATEETEALTYVRDVILNRNAMTLIHSVMLANIACTITSCLVDKAPELFFEMLNTRDPRHVRAKGKYLIDYTENSAQLHDVGKAYISDVINLQTRRLTDEEFGLIRMHPTFGDFLLKDTKLGARYRDVILGHHKGYDGKGGYPFDFDNTQSPIKIIIDIITIADCIDAATDTLGRNYTRCKKWVPDMAEELSGDTKNRYNQSILSVICRDKKTSDNISYITDEGRKDTYFRIYRDYISDEKKDSTVEIETVKIK